MRIMFQTIGEYSTLLFPPPLLDRFKANTAGQDLYTAEYGYTTLGIASVIHTQEYGTELSVSASLAALLLRMPHARDVPYDLPSTIKLLKKANLDPEAHYLYEEQMFGRVPTSNESKSIHDAEILSLLTSDAPHLIAFVIKNTRQTQCKAYENLKHVMKSQTMYTQLGKDMLKAITPDLCSRLEKFCD